MGIFSSHMLSIEEMEKFKKYKYLNVLGQANAESIQHLKQFQGKSICLMKQKTPSLNQIKILTHLN